MSSGSDPIGDVGWATRAVSKVSKWAASRAMVPAANKSVLYSNTPFRPAALSYMSRLISNRAALLSISSAVTVSPGRANVDVGVLWRINIAWNSALWLSCRSILRASTTCSKGTSLWLYALSAVVLTCCRNCSKVCWAVTFERKTRLLTKRPMRSLVSARSRLLTVEPTKISDCPE